jgi:hypothetical protein
MSRFSGPWRLPEERPAARVNADGYFPVTSDALPDTPGNRILKLWAALKTLVKCKGMFNLYQHFDTFTLHKVQ